MVLEEFIKEWNDDGGTVRVRTSGSTGKPKEMLVEKERMAASARITCSFLGLKRGDTALLCMPLDYIAGKMMVVRSLVCGLKLIAVEPSGHPLRGFTSGGCPEISFAAMVPMQVYNSMQVDGEREILRGIRHLIIGGGAVDGELAAALRDFPNAVWSTYGMTETLSHIALRRINGEEASDWYTPFSGVSVKVDNQSRIIIDAPHVCKDVLTTNDIGEMAPDGRCFRVLGRMDNTICSGGIKIQIEEVESMLGPFADFPFLITKKKDSRLGETVVMLVEGSHIPKAKEICGKVLPKYSQPRIYIKVERLPMTETGKPARREAQLIAEGC